MAKETDRHWLRGRFATMLFSLLPCTRKSVAPHGQQPIPYKSENPTTASTAGTLAPEPYERTPPRRAMRGGQ
eukprot:495847-Lingulodinium_polyedra.AAC.1